MLTREDEEQLYKEIAEDFERQRAKWEAAKKELQGLIHPKYFDFVEMNDSYASEGIVEIIETDEKQNGYGKDQRNCRIKEEKFSGLYMRTTGEVEYHYGVEGDHEGENVIYWVNQWNVGMEGDSFAGHLLLPMNNGRYWKVSYSC